MNTRISHHPWIYKINEESTVVTIANHISTMQFKFRKVWSLSKRIKSKNTNTNKKNAKIKSDEGIFRLSRCSTETGKQFHSINDCSQQVPISGDYPNNVNQL